MARSVASAERISRFVRQEYASGFKTGHWAPGCVRQAIGPEETRLPEVGPADEVGGAGDGDEDGDDVGKELYGGVAILFGADTGNSQEKEGQAGHGEKNNPERYATDFSGQGRHAGMLAGKEESVPACVFPITLKVNLLTLIEFDR